MIHSNNTISCPTNYVFNCTMCVPICGLWHPYGENYFITHRVVNILTSVVDFIFCFIGLIVLLRVPGSFKFPQINYLFMLINAVIFSFLFAVMSISGPRNFFCQQRNEGYSVVSQDPPVYVNIAGFMVHFVYLSFNLWFLCATINLLIVVFRPQLLIAKSRRFQIVLFTIEAIISLGIPLLLPSIFLISFKNYSFERVPDIPYTSDSIAAVIFIIFPLLLSTAVSLTVIAISIYKLQMRKLIFIENKKDSTKLKSFEIRLIIFAICLGFIVFIVLLQATHEELMVAMFDFKLEDFWSCLTIQENLEIFQASNETCPTEYRAYASPIFILIGDILLSAWTILLLVMLTTQETRDAWKKILTNIFLNPFIRSVSRFKQQCSRPIIAVREEMIEADN